MSIVSKMLGRFAPSYQPFNQWCLVYMQIINTRHLSKKTLSNRRVNVAHLCAAMGHLPMCKIKPMHIAVAARDIWQSGRQVTAQRVLIESVDIFYEAINAGVLNTNPAMHVKQLPAPVVRQRLSLEQWQAMYIEAVNSNIAWLPKLLLLALVTGQRRADLQKMRFADVWDNKLHIVQQKTKVRLALPLDLQLHAVDWTIEQVIDSCRHYADGDEFLLRKQNGEQIGIASLSFRFQYFFEHAVGKMPIGRQPSLHECRSLSERLYRVQGIDTQTLLGHKRRSMTDKYNDDRGLNVDDWKTLVL